MSKRKALARKIIYVLFALFLSTYMNSIFALNVPISVFSLENYSQDVGKWLPPNDSKYHAPLVSLSYQKERLKDLYRHLYATDSAALSPWSEKFVATVLNKNPGVLYDQTTLIEDFNNTGKSEKDLGYGENFRVYTNEWNQKIAYNMQLSQFNLPIVYDTKNRAIVVKNTHARLLPTYDPHFYSAEQPGQGYPFDNLQSSALWVGMPVYKIGESRDKAWVLVMTPSFISWVENDAIALVTESFIRQWQKLATAQLMAITQTQTPILNTHKIYQFSAYIGTVLPLIEMTTDYVKVAIPQKTSIGIAQIDMAWVSKDSITKMPMPATPANFTHILKNLQDRPYGWGNMYFYNDCSAEMSSLYTPFGFWFPRNSSKQFMAGKMIDLTNKSDEDRLRYLIEKGHPLMTVVYIGGHNFMYVGNYSDSRNPGTLTAMTYQTIWGLSPPDRSRRAVIGQSVFLPLLPVYPEDSTLSPLTKKNFFNVIYLDEWPDPPSDYTTIFFNEISASRF